MKNYFTHKLIGLLALTFCAGVANADIPESYYRSVSGKCDAELKTALHTLLYNHTEVSSYTNLPQYFQRTDVYPYGNERYGQWWDMYSDIPLYLPSFSGLNREHAFPKSWWGGSTDTPAYVDLNHLYPSEAKANMAKSNYPLGTVQTPLFDNGITRVGYPVTGQGGGAAQVFEPDDEYKGDFARTYFYMATCYQNLSWKYTYMVGNNTYPTLTPWAISLLLQWHRQDPVSQKEIDRNNVVYTIQANCNPFIDHPELAEYLWGDKKGQIWTPGNSGQEPAGEPELITPVQDMSLDFGETAVGSTNTSSLFFQGQNLTGKLTITISGLNRKFFSSESSEISASVVNSDNGFWLKVYYKPTEEGDHVGRLIVSDGGMEGSRGIALRGSALPVPSLTAFNALPATDVTDNSYTANWETPANDVVDYYVVTRTLYLDGNSSSEDLLAETNELQITDCTPGTRESYNVRSCRLGYYSERSNEVFVDLLNAGIADVALDNPLGWAYVPGGVRLVCGVPHTNCRVFDAAGRLVRVVETIENNTVIELPFGAYLITTDQQARPLRVLVRN